MREADQAAVHPRLLEGPEDRGDAAGPTIVSRMEDDARWADATWEGAAEASVRDGPRMSMAERLAWLEEMGRLAERPRSTA